MKIAARGASALSTRIGLLSDVHATPEPVAEALALFKSRGVDRILCPGDIAGYGADLDHTVALLLEHDCQAVLGNHEIWHLEKHAADEESLSSTPARGTPQGVHRKGYTARVGKSVASQRLDGVCTAVVVPKAGNPLIEQLAIRLCEQNTLA
ncbi:MAG: metallophosphoesterase family protein [Gallionella sp.]